MYVHNHILAIAYCKKNAWIKYYSDGNLDNHHKLQYWKQCLLMKEEVQLGMTLWTLNNEVVVPLQNMFQLMNSKSQVKVKSQFNIEQNLQTLGPKT